MSSLISSNKPYYYFESKSKNNSDADINHSPTSINKIIENVVDFCKAYIKKKYTRIIKSKKMASTFRQL